MREAINKDDEWSYGVIRWFNNQTGFGFISELIKPELTLALDKDIMLHYREIVSNSPRIRLAKGELVKFKKVTTEKGISAGSVEIYKDKLTSGEK